MAQQVTSTGLMTSPLTELVRYDSTWSYRVSHNPQTDRFSAPYPEFGVFGTSPFRLHKTSISDSQRLPEIEERTSHLQNAASKRENRVKRESEISAEGKHLRLKFGDKTLVENGALELKDIDDFFNGRPNSPEDGSHKGSSAQSEGGSDIASKIKINRIAEESKDHFSKQSTPKASVAFAHGEACVTPAKHESTRGSVNFLRMRTLIDADEGASLRMKPSIQQHPTASNNKANNWPYSSNTRVDQPVDQDPHSGEKNKSNGRRSQRPSASLAENTLAGRLMKNSEFNLMAEGGRQGGSILRHRGSILRRESKNSSGPGSKPGKKAPSRGSVAFHSASQPFSATNQRLPPPFGSPKSERLTSNGQEDASYFRSMEAPEEDLIEAHEGHTRAFEQLRTNRIRVDEKEEGKIFRLSFDPFPMHQENKQTNHENGSISSGKEHVKFPKMALKEDRTPSFEELRRSKILPEEKEEGTAFMRTCRVYHGSDGGVYGISILFPEKNDRKDLRKFYMSRKENPQDRITLLTHDDGHVFGFYKPQKTCLRNYEEVSGEDPRFQLIYDTSNAVVGFKTDDPKDDHSADFERLRQEMIIKGEREEGTAFKTLCKMVYTDGVNLEEHLPLKHFQDHRHKHRAEEH